MISMSRCRVPDWLCTNTPRQDRRRWRDQRSGLSANRRQSPRQSSIEVRTGRSSMKLSQLLEGVRVVKLFQTMYGRMVVTHDVEVQRLQYEDRKSTRLNSSHGSISYAVFCLTKKMNSLPFAFATATTRHTAPLT